jgi:hypothetical protein
VIPLKALSLDQAEKLFYEPVPGMRGLWRKHNINGEKLLAISIAYLDGLAGGTREFRESGLILTEFLDVGDIEVIRDILREVSRGVPVDRFH